MSCEQASSWFLLAQRIKTDLIIQISKVIYEVTRGAEKFSIELVIKMQIVFTAGPAAEWFHIYPLGAATLLYFSIPTHHYYHYFWE
jgi:hypothetical protein